MKNYRTRLVAAALLGTSALIAPSLARAATPAPSFTTIDDHNVDLTTGLPWFAMEEGGIGSGEGRVAMQRIYAEGAGWLDNWSGGLYDVIDGGVTKKLVSIAGISDRFSGSGTTWTSDKGDGATLTADATGAYTYTGRDGTKIAFFGDGFASASYFCPGSSGGTCHVPKSITRPNGMTFSMTWGQARLCAQPIGPDCGEWMIYRRLSSVTSSAGYKLAITYLTDVPGSGTEPQANWYVRTAVSFTNLANPPSPEPGIGYSYGTNTISVTDPGGRTWVFTTDASGRLTGIQRPGSTGNNISYVYGTSGTVSSGIKDGVTNSYSLTTSGSTGTMTVTNPLSQSIVVTSDQTKGRPTSYKDPLNRTTAYEYDSNARLTKITAPELNYTTYHYDSRGNIDIVTNVPKPNSGLSNIVTSATYDPNCTDPTTSIAKCNKPNTTTDARGQVTNYTYDLTHGGLTKLELPAANGTSPRPTATYSYSATSGYSGSVWELTGASTCRTALACAGTADETKKVISYNSNLLPISVTTSDGTGAILTATTEMAYDPRANMTAFDGPLGGDDDTTAYKYDAADQLVGIISPDPDGTGALPNRAIRITYRGDGQVSKREIGTTAGQLDPAWAAFSPHQTVDLTYDTNSRPVTIKLSAGGTNYALTQVNYDTLGRLNCSARRMNTAAYGSLPLSACSLGTEGSFGPDRVSQIVYDVASEVTQLKVAVGTSDAATERTLSYTDNGLIQTLKDAENNLSTFVYDAFDRLKRIRYPLPTKGANASSTTDYQEYSYDPNSNVTQFRTRASETINYIYDNLDRVTDKDSASVPPVDYTYDLLGQLLTAKFSATGGGVTNGEGVTNAYDALGRLTSSTSDVGGTAHKLSYLYDLAGRRVRLTWWDGLYVHYERLVTGEISKVQENGATSGAGLLATYGYDDLGNRLSLIRGNGTSTSYAWDPVSRLQSLTHDLSGTSSDLTETFTYNPAGQIASVVRSNDAYAFTQQASGSTSYTANGLNEFATINAAATAHDSNGNLTSDPLSGHAFTYDAENKMKVVDAGTASQVPMRYDPLGRFDLYDPGAARRFVYDGVQPVAEITSGGSMVARYVPGDGADEWISYYLGSTTTDRRWLHQDERSSVLGEADVNGTATRINRYDEYGIPQSTNPGRFGYTGQMWLPEVGLYNYKARIYWPGGGRFQQPDLIGYADSPNLYAYVLNDPIDLIDPFGLCQYPGTGSVTGSGNDVTVTCPRWDFGGGSGGDVPGAALNAIDPRPARLAWQPDRDPNDKPQCPTGPRLLIPIAAVGGTVFGFTRGLSFALSLKLAIPFSAWRTGLTGSQAVLSGSFTGLMGAGAFYGIGRNLPVGATSGPIPVGLHSSFSNNILQGGAAWLAGGEVAVDTNGITAEEGEVSVGSRAGYGAYIAAGAQKSITLATPQAFCSQ